jgi:hypothetical protein
MDKGGKVRWWQPAPSLRTHGILGMAVSILGAAAGMALGVGSTVILGVALIHYFQGSCSVLNCMNQVPFFDWFWPLLLISTIFGYIEKLIVRRRRLSLE